VFLGEVSYSLYIIHNFTGILISQVAKRVPGLEERLQHGSLLGFVVALTAATIGGTILHFGLELPARRWLTVNSGKIRFWDKSVSVR
jgi:peptidoglycan/LPS O-acetylase OafA/YrhL